jgi:hypothetical protein
MVHPMALLLGSAASCTNTDCRAVLTASTYASADCSGAAVTETYSTQTGCRPDNLKQRWDGFDCRALTRSTYSKRYCKPPVADVAILTYDACASACVPNVSADGSIVGSVRVSCASPYGGFVGCPSGAASPTPGPQGGGGSSAGNSLSPSAWPIAIAAASFFVAMGQYVISESRLDDLDLDQMQHGERDARGA